MLYIEVHALLATGYNLKDFDNHVNLLILKIIACPDYFGGSDNLDDHLFPSSERVRIFTGPIKPDSESLYCPPKGLV